jgi:predicted hydrocarbon binding protein
MDFTFDEETGVIVDKATDDRCIIFAKARLEQIFLRLNELFQSGAQVIIAESFRAAGKWFINEIPKEAKADLPKFLDKAIVRFKDGGLGRIEIVKLDLEKSEITFRIWNNLFAEMFQDDSTYCYCVEAYVSGIFEQLIGVAPEIAKTKCLGKGDMYCEWTMKSPQPREGGKA